MSNPTHLSDAGVNRYQNPASAALTLDQYLAEHSDEETTRVEIGTKCLVTLNDYSRVLLPVGTYDLPVTLADHPYVQAHFRKDEPPPPVPQTFAPAIPRVPPTPEPFVPTSLFEEDEKPGDAADDASEESEQSEDEDDEEDGASDAFLDEVESEEADHGHPDELPEAQPERQGKRSTAHSKPAHGSAAVHAHHGAAGGGAAKKVKAPEAKSVGGKKKAPDKKHGPGRHSKIVLK